MPTLPGPRRRNPTARSLLLRKGGVHQRSKSGLRAEAKQQLQDELEFWQEGREEGFEPTGKHFQNIPGNVPVNNHFFIASIH